MSRNFQIGTITTLGITMIVQSEFYNRQMRKNVSEILDELKHIKMKQERQIELQSIQNTYQLRIIENQLKQLTQNENFIKQFSWKFDL